MDKGHDLRVKRYELMEVLLLKMLILKSIRGLAK